MELRYRPEIDGLRTLAVLSVIIYHSEIYFGDLQMLKGGFFGVDIFFVISGFLITSIIMEEYHLTGKFSIVNFYERRVRRLLPALFVVMIVSLPFAWYLLLPLQLVDFSKSVLSSILFGSNFYWDLTMQEYGAESSLLRPFLHTWSLAVEEQYYIVFPVFLIATYRWLKKYTVALLTVGLLISLLFAEEMTALDASFSFYMLQTRFWELLAGALLANILFFHPQKDNDSLLKRVMPILGVFLIVYSMSFIDIKSHHPGFITLIPVIGTMLIIWFANDNDLVTMVLSTRVFVGIGLISYSLYLWHYPVFAFGRYLEVAPTWLEKMQWLFLVFIASFVTYHVIEKPFRNKNKVSRQHLFFWVTLALVVISSTSIYWLVNNGVESRLGYLASVLKDSSRVWVTKDNQKCHSGGNGRRPAFPLSESCVFVYDEDARYLVVVGDSHAGSLSERLRVLANENAYNFIQITGAGCSHVKNIQTGICRQRADQLTEFLRKYPESIIVYNSRVPLLLEMEAFDNHEGDKEANHVPASSEEVNKHFPVRSKAIVDTLTELRDIAQKLVIVYPVPEQGFHVKDKLFSIKRLINNKEDLPLISTSYDVFKERVKRSYEVLDKVIGDNIYRIYPEVIFCQDETGRCIVSERDNVYFYGDNHVSPLGASLIIKQVAQALDM